MKIKHLLLIIGILSYIIYQFFYFQKFSDNDKNLCFSIDIAVTVMIFFYLVMIDFFTRPIRFICKILNKKVLP